MNDLVSVQFQDGSVTGSIKYLFCVLIVSIIIGLGVCIGLALGRKVGA